MTKDEIFRVLFNVKRRFRLKGEVYEGLMSKEEWDVFDEALKCLSNLEESKKGRWIIHYDDLFPEESTRECDQCHEEQLVWNYNDHNYCPNCGAKMEN